MPRIDPLQLLNCLHVLLTPTGGMKSENEVARISSLMEKFSKKLVSKCVYLLILKNSDPALLSRFMTLGGWNLIYHWLIQAIEAKNYPFLIELLEVILVCPVDIDRMKSNPMPRVVKALSKDANIDPKARDIASEIVKDWLVIVKSTPSVTTQTATRAPVTAPPTDPSEKLNEGSESSTDIHMNEVHHPSSENSAGGEEEEDESYTKSTSPSSSSAESDDSDVFVPYQKTQAKSKKKPGPKKGKSSVKKSSAPEEKRQLKSKLITNPGAKGEKSGPIKLKIQVSSTESRSRKSSDEKTIEEKLKEKRKLKDDKEKEKFARFKQEREKKEKRDKPEPDTKSRENKHFDEKLKGELSKLIPKSIEKLGRIPKLNKDKEKENGAVSADKRKDEKKPPVKSEEKKPDRTKEGEKSREKDAKRDRDGKKVPPVPPPPPPPKKPVSISVEKRTAGEVKPKTVKAYNSKFRLTGLEQEVVPKPAARKSGSVSSSSPNSVSAGYERNAIKRSPTKDVENEPIEKRLKSPEEEKLSPAAHRNKKPFLQESDSFMNAMDIALMTQKEQLRKRKKPPQKSESEEKIESPSPVRKNSDVSSPVITKTESAIKTEPVAEVKPAFRFYKDTLETSMDESTDTTEAKEEPKEEADIKMKSEPVDDDKSKENLVDAASDPSKPRSAVGLKSSLSLFRTKKLPKKSVTWRADDELEAVQFFEVDATERTNVVRNFWEMQMMERTKERDMMMVRKSGDNDKMVVQTKWKPLIQIDLTPPTTARGANSQEKNIQYARERIVPPSLYYNKSMVPDTPAEPDLEIHPVTTPPVIPLDDISGSADSVNDFSSYKWPEPKGFAPDNVDVNAMKGFLPGMPPPIFPPFPDGTFPPPFAQPFFPGGAVPPLPVPSNWNATSADSSQSSSASAVPWVPPGVVPPPGMIGPPPFGMMAPFPPIPGAAFPPNMFPMNNAVNTTESTTTSSTTESQYSNSNYSTSGNKDSSTGGSGSGGGSSNSGSGGKKWTNDDRYYGKKDNWRNNYNDRRSDKRGSGSWRGSGSNSRLCRFYQKKGFCSVSGCRFYHPDKN